MNKEESSQEAVTGVLMTPGMFVSHLVQLRRREDGTEFNMTYSSGWNHALDAVVALLAELEAVLATPPASPASQEAATRVLSELRRQIEPLLAGARRVASDTSRSGMERLWTGKAIAYETVLGAMARLEAVFPTPPASNDPARQEPTR